MLKGGGANRKQNKIYFAKHVILQMMVMDNFLKKIVRSLRPKTCLVCKLKLEQQMKYEIIETKIK